MKGERRRFWKGERRVSRLNALGDEGSGDGGGSEDKTNKLGEEWLVWKGEE